MTAKHSFFFEPLSFTDLSTLCFEGNGFLFLLQTLLFQRLATHKAAHGVFHFACEVTTTTGVVTVVEVASGGDGSIIGTDRISIWIPGLSIRSRAITRLLGGRVVLGVISATGMSGGIQPSGIVASRSVTVICVTGTNTSTDTSTSPSSSGMTGIVFVSCSTLSRFLSIDSSVYARDLGYPTATHAVFVAKERHD